MVPTTSFAKPSCGKGKHWVEAHFRSGYLRNDGVRVKPTQVSGHCRKNPRGYEQWHRTLSNKRPKIWGYKKEKSKKWTVEEVQRLYDAILVLPDKLLDLKNVKIYRMSRSKDKGNPGTSNSTDIVLYDQTFEHKDSLAQILSHELSHVLYMELSFQEKTEFRKNADWVEHEIFKGAYMPNKEKIFIQEDSKISPSEDFANHIEHYLFKNKLLEKQSGRTYRWIKKRLGPEFQIRKRRVR